jgi:DNA topoisomerase IA
MFGDDYVADQPRRYDRKVKNAQEAHEAIRPAGESVSFAWMKRRPNWVGTSARCTT